MQFAARSDPLISLIAACISPLLLTADSTRNIVRPAIKFRAARGLIKRAAHIHEQRGSMSRGVVVVGGDVARCFYIFLLGVATFFKRRGYHRGPSKSFSQHHAPYARPSQTPPLDNTLGRSAARVVAAERERERDLVIFSLVLAHRKKVGRKKRRETSGRAVEEAGLNAGQVRRVANAEVVWRRHAGGRAESTLDYPSTECTNGPRVVLRD